jgi:hypothetical protein
MTPVSDEDPRPEPPDRGLPEVIEVEDDELAATADDAMDDVPDDAPAPEEGPEASPAAAAEESPQREDWAEGPDEHAPPESWLGFDDDDLLHRISRATPGDEDEQLLEIVESDRHFFVRQEAAKKIGDRDLLFRFEDDRHIGQILVRHLNRREDVTYLERLVERSHHVEVRVAAQIHLAKLWGRLGGPTRGALGGPALPPPEFRESAEEPAPEAGAGLAPAPPEAAGAKGGVPESGSGGEESARSRVDATLLGWALHFVVEAVWQQLGTTATRGLLRRTHAELLPANDSLSAFRVEDDAHVSVDLQRSRRLSQGSVDAVARWLVTFLDAASRSSDEVSAIDVRAATRLMGDALDDVGFYRSVGAAWSTGRRS